MAAIWSLPEEIRGVIFEQFISDVDVTLEDIKQLRLICKGFASHHTILRSLFKNINLIADDIWLGKLRESNLGPIKRFVKSITFLPPLYAWTINSVLFHSIVRNAWAWQYGCYDAERNVAEIDPPARIREAYKPYRSRARRNKTLLVKNAKDVEDVWADFLKSCSNCHAFTFGFVDYLILDSDLAPDYPSCLRAASRKHFSSNLRALKARVVANAAFGIALQALTRCPISIREFEIKQPFSDEGVKGLISRGHLRMNFGNLRSLSLVHYNKGHHHRDLDEGWLWHGQVTNELSSFTTWCGATLETLICSSMYAEDDASWDLDPTPALRTIHFMESNIPSRCLAALISSSPRLDRLLLESVGLFDGHWQRVFDAVRHHESSIEVTLDRIECTDYRYSLAPFRTRVGSTALEYGSVYPDGNIVPLDDPDSVDVALRNYLDNAIEWNDVLEDLFKGFDF